MTDLISQYLNQIVDFIGDNPSFAGVIVFLISMGEALFIIGLFVPSTVVLVGAGTLVGLGKLDAWPILIWTIMGAIAGDAISYWVGYVYKDRLKNLWPLTRYRGLVERGEEYFKVHGGKSVFIGRFVPGVKAIVPGIAGMAGMDATRFTIINVVSAVAWAIVHLGPGFIAGTAFAALGEVSSRLAIVLGALVAILFLAVMLGRWLILIILPLFAGSRLALANWFARRPGRLAKWCALAFDPSHPRSAGILASALLLLICFPAFVWIASEISPGQTLTRADLAIRNLFHDLRTPAGDWVMVFLTMLGDGVVCAAVGAAVAGYLFLRKAWRRGAGFLIALASAAVFVPLFKLAIHRERPIDIYTGADAFSFPSGHATINTVLYGIVAVLIAHDRSPLAKAGVFTVTVIYILAIAFSRIYLGAHWMSDVIGGLVFGTAMVSVFAFIFGSVHNEKIGRWVLAALTAATLAVVGGFHIARNMDGAILMYDRESPGVLLPLHRWFEEDWRQLPERRIELSGETEEPLTIQWAGDLIYLHAVAAAQGWKTAPGWSLSSSTGFLVSQTPPDSLPTLPRTHNGRTPAMVLIRADGETPAADGEGETHSSERVRGRWVLRLWPSAFKVEKNNMATPIYVGSIVHETVRYPFDELSTVETDRDEAPSRDNPLAKLPTANEKHRDGASLFIAADPRI